MNPLSSKLPFHVHNWLIISLKNYCIVIRKWPNSIHALHETSSPRLHHLQLIGVVLLMGVPDSGAVFQEEPYKGEVSGFP